jgi:hypothetical protein
LARLERSIANPRESLVGSTLLSGIAQLKAYERILRYSDSRNFWQLKATCAEPFGAPPYGDLDL